MKKISTLIFAGIVLFTNSTFAQKAPKNEVNYEDILDSVNAKILRGINAARYKANLDEMDSHDILLKVAKSQAEKMAKSERLAMIEGSAGKAVKKEGGNANVVELVFQAALGKGKTDDEAQEIANLVIEKWLKSKKEKPILMSGNYTLSGVGCYADKSGRKMYISMILGNYTTFNLGAKHRKELKLRYTKKQKGLKTTADEKVCKTCDKFKDYDGLIKGVYIEGTKVMLKYENWKKLKKILPRPGDMLAVDIIQKVQYEKSDEYNIVDNSLVNKGIRLKPVNAKKMADKNTLKKSKEKTLKNTIDTEIGRLPKKLTGDYEINLLVFQNKKLCKTIMPSYIEEGDQESNSNVDMLLSQDSASFFPVFKPNAENSMLQFIVPFEKNKSEYNPDDMTGFIKTLQEPDFEIDGLYIYAYSSIEGDLGNNQKLQEKRAQSIVQALQALQKGRNIKAQIKTSDSWEQFKTEQAEGPYKELAAMKKEDAMRKINGDPKLLDELEPIFAKHRYAKIVMDVLYDIKGNKEQKYATMAFNRAVKNNDQKLAMKIQYFIHKQIRDGKYDEAIIKNMDIPKTPVNSNLAMNQVVYRYFDQDKEVFEADVNELGDLEKVDAANKFINYNKIFGEIKTATVVPKPVEINAMQARIDALYNTRIPKKAVDGLNTEYQFWVIQAYDSLDNGENIVQGAVNKIKTFYNFKEGTWQNALKLAYVFKRFKDFKFAAQLLEPFISDPKANEQLLFTYLSFCSQLPDKIKTKAFVTAMQNASTINKTRYCELFGAPKLTFQVLDNPSVKKDFLEKCGSK